MPLQIIRKDITRLPVDAIVNAANRSLLGGGGVDGAIHRAAGRELLEECRTLGGCETGDAKITKGYRLPAKYVIHTVGPIWQDGRHGEEKLLRSCYRRSLELAAEHDCETVAVPLISSGVYGYPKKQALDVAVDEIVCFLQKHEMTVFLVIFDKTMHTVDRQTLAAIDDYLREGSEEISGAAKLCAVPAGKNASAELLMDAALPDGELDHLLGELDEGFSEMLLRKIDEKGMTDVECYKKANIDRKLFSKIRSDKEYRPRKTTVLAFAVALELTLDETEKLLQKAGFALTSSRKFDRIVQYYIENGEYNIMKINETLFDYDQSLLGA